MPDVAAQPTTAAPAPRVARRARAKAGEPRRDNKLRVRLRADELAEVEARAAARSMTVSDYCRSLVLRDHQADGVRLLVGARRMRAERATMIHAVAGLGLSLSRIGNNVNQIAAQANTAAAGNGAWPAGDEVAATMAPVRDELARIEAAVAELRASLSRHSHDDDED